MGDYTTRKKAMEYIEYAIIELGNFTYYNNTHKYDKIRKNGKTLTEDAQHEIKVKVEQIINTHYNSTYKAEVSKCEYPEFEQYYNKICQLAEVLQLDIFKEMTKKPLKHTETWKATELLTTFGAELRLGTFGSTLMGGIATVTFTNGDKTFVQKYEVLSIYSEGISVAVGIAETTTIHTKEFLIENTTEQNIKKSFTGTSRSFGASVSIGSLGLYVGKAYGIDTKTWEKDNTGWTGSTLGRSVGLGVEASITEQESVYMFDTYIWSNPEVDKYFSNLKDKIGFKR